MARKREDLTGQRFGRLLVISYNEEVSKQKKISSWNCKCDCGNEKVVLARHLKSGNTTSCGCYNRERSEERREDLTGMRFGRLTVISINKQKEGSYWNCKCDCGNEKIVWSADLKRGRTTSCGCFSREKSRDIMKRINEELWKDDVFIQMHKNINWKGGITPISKHLRDLPIISQWRKDTYIRENNRCQLTGKKVHGGNSNVHHLYGFNMIVLDAHILNNIQIHENIGEYTQEELYKLEEYVASWHKDTSNAVLLHTEVHNLFHKAKDKGGYGHGNNTPEQFEEFKQRYLNGEFEGLI